ncbi:Methionine gamma-lyase [Vigna angularis]|uniref:Methionine gamma-lyase n=1 Tax=Phaseolus angularis TaxID=3914 RepID=A0A8T0KCG9_PHAAN|nr:Methionine gamma-lyase [Vigna angularis]
MAENVVANRKRCDTNVVSDGGTKRKNATRDMGPATVLALTCHEFGEHGCVNLSIEASAAFTDMEPEILRRNL